MAGGGVVGMQPRRMGLGADERPIIAHTGERVIAKGDPLLGPTNISIHMPPGMTAREVRESGTQVARKVAAELARKGRFG